MLGYDWVISEIFWCAAQTGNSCGYGFVLYDSKEAGMNAINALNGMQIDSKRLKVSIARPNTEVSTVGTEGTNLYMSGKHCCCVCELCVRVFWSRRSCWH